jgi:hypothetical protein
VKLKKSKICKFYENSIEYPDISKQNQIQMGIFKVNLLGKLVKSNVDNIEL